MRLKLIVALLIALLTGYEMVNADIKTPIKNGTLQSDATGVNTYGWTNLSKVGVGNGTPTEGLIQLFPTAYTNTQGIKIGTGASAVNIYRSASGTLTIVGDMIVSGSLTANGGTISGGGGVGLGDNNTWTGSNTFNGAVVTGDSGITFSPAGAGVTRTSLSLVPGTDVQVHDEQLDSLATCAWTNNYMLLGDGSKWTSASPTAVKSALSLTPGADIQVFDTDLTTIAGLTAGSGNILLSDNGNWTAATASTVRTALSLRPGTDVQAYDADLATIAGLTPSGTSFMVYSGSLARWTSSNTLDARTALGLGLSDTPVFTALTLQSGTGGTRLLDTHILDNIMDIMLPSTSWAPSPTLVVTTQMDGRLDATGGLVNAVPVANGGTGKTSIGAGKFLYSANGTSFSEGSVGTTGLAVLGGISPLAIQTTLSLVPGVNVQAFDPDLQTIGQINVAPAGVMTSNGAAWIKSTYSQTRDLLGLGTADSVSFANVDAAIGHITAGTTGTTPALQVTGSTLTLAEIEGTADNWETSLKFVDPTADRTITFPDATGTVALTTKADGSIPGAEYAGHILVNASDANATDTRTDLSPYDQTKPFATLAAAVAAAANNDLLIVDGTTTGTVSFSSKTLYIQSNTRKSITGTITLGEGATLHLFNVEWITNSSMTLTSAMFAPTYLWLHDSKIANPTGTTVVLNADTALMVCGTSEVWGFGTPSCVAATSGNVYLRNNSKLISSDVAGTTVVSGTGNFGAEAGAYIGGPVTGLTGAPLSGSSGLGAGTVLGSAYTSDLFIKSNVLAVVEGTTVDTNQTTITVADPGADRTIQFPNASGTVVVDQGDAAGITVNRLTLEEDAWDDVTVPLVQGRAEVAGNPTFSTFGGGVKAYAFDKDTDQSLFVTFQLPHRYKAGSDLKAHIHVAPSTNAAGTSAWGLEYYIASVDGTFAAGSTLYGNVDMNAGATLKHYICPLGTISGTGLKESTVLVCRVFRDADASGGSSDTYAADVFGLSVDLHIKVDKLGTPAETPP